MVHELKVHPDYFQYLDHPDITIRKNFEVRFDDRDYNVGDFLVLREYKPETKEYTGNQVTKYVTYILRDTRYCIPGFCIMSLT